MKQGLQVLGMYVAMSGCQFSTLGLHLGTSIVGHKEEPLSYMHFKILNVNYILYNKYMCMYVHTYNIWFLWQVPRVFPDNAYTEQY